MTNPAKAPDADPRKALEESEKRASATHPENFKDDATDEKIVEIDPIGRDDAAIKGIDPDR